MDMRGKKIANRKISVIEFSTFGTSNNQSRRKKNTNENENPHLIDYCDMVGITQIRTIQNHLDTGHTGPDVGATEIKNHYGRILFAVCTLKIIAWHHRTQLKNPWWWWCWSMETDMFMCANNFCVFRVCPFCAGIIQNMRMNGADELNETYPATVRWFEFIDRQMNVKVEWVKNTQRHKTKAHQIHTNKCFIFYMYHIFAIGRVYALLYWTFLAKCSKHFEAERFFCCCCYSRRGGVVSWSTSGIYSVQRNYIYILFIAYTRPIFNISHSSQYSFCSDRPSIPCM